jgi:hypothetical protein
MPFSNKYTTYTTPAQVVCGDCGKLFQNTTTKAVQLMVRLHKQKEHNSGKVSFIEVLPDFEASNKHNGVENCVVSTHRRK